MESKGSPLKYLFYFVHPSKFYLFRNSINHLKSKGHKVEILISSKDVLEELVISEGWEYTNLFPSGRKGKKLPAILYTGFYFFITIARLWKYARNKKYDLFVTDDLLVYVGRFRKIPSIVFLDDDISVVKPFSLILSQATHILAPDITDLGKFTYKKISFPGYKELAYLHPNNFQPNHKVVQKINPDNEKYFVVRLVNLVAYHDMGKKGISNDQIRRLLEILNKHGRIYITSERELPNDLEKYRLSINPREISHVLYYAEMFIGDSQTMCSEAALLGTPTFRCNDFKGKINVMDDKDKYGLMSSYRSDEFELMIDQIEEVLLEENLKESYKAKKDKMLIDKIDVGKFMKWLLHNYPESVNEINKKNFSFRKFK